MSQKVALTLLVAVLVALAGCGGSANQTTTAVPNDTTSNLGSGMSTSTETPTTTKTLSSITLPKGVTQDSVEETTLLKTHTQTLGNTTFTEKIRVGIATAVNLDDPKVMASTHTAYANPSSGEAYVMQQADNGPGKSMYSDGSTAYIKTTNEGGSQYAVSSRRLSANEIVAPFMVESYLNAAGFTPQEVVTKDGQTFIKLSVTGVEKPGLLRDEMKAQSVGNATGTALVDTTGRIHNLNLSIQYVPKQADVTNEIRVSMNLENVGSTSVEKPSWVSQAKEKALATDISLVDQQYVEVTPTNGQIKGGTSFFVFLKGHGDSKVTVSQEVASGESVFLYAQGGEIKLSTTKPSNAQKTDGYSLVAVGPNGNELFRSSA